MGAMAADGGALLAAAVRAAILAKAPRRTVQAVAVAVAGVILRPPATAAPEPVVSERAGNQRAASAFASDCASAEVRLEQLREARRARRKRKKERRRARSEVADTVDKEGDVEMAAGAPAEPASASSAAEMLPRGCGSAESRAISAHSAQSAKTDDSFTTRESALERLRAEPSHYDLKAVNKTEIVSAGDGGMQVAPAAGSGPSVPRRRGGKSRGPQHRQ